MIYERFRGVIARVGRMFYDSDEVDFRANAYTLQHTRENIKFKYNIIKT